MLPLIFGSLPFWPHKRVSRVLPGPFVMRPRFGGLLSVQKILTILCYICGVWFFLRTWELSLAIEHHEEGRVFFLIQWSCTHFNLFFKLRCIRILVVEACQLLVKLLTVTLASLISFEGILRTCPILRVDVRDIVILVLSTTFSGLLLSHFLRLFQLTDELVDPFL